MGLILTDFFEPVAYEEKDNEVIVCNDCSAHLCLSNLVLSDQFWGSSGDAYLVDRLINIASDKQDLETSMRTGIYIINKIRCSQCKTVLGWFYKKAFKYSEFYKEGKYVIEKKYIRQITNHCTNARLTENAKLSKRRRSSASTASSSADDNISIQTFRSRLNSDDYVIAASVPGKGHPRRASVLTFREGISQMLGHRGLQPGDKIDLDERDENSEACLDS
ncbi:hypothetical protein JCM33374_g4429 [Metschnikowia sp. JCM 33374]|nr:hypothetical protein JCM33374_g4429 [Metschnikowia sp. JCM 33374]